MDTMKWRKSSRSSNGGDTCVELARVPGTQTLAARDSKNPAGPQIRLDTAEWRTLLSSIKRGERDL